METNDPGDAATPDQQRPDDWRARYEGLLRHLPEKQQAQVRLILDAFPEGSVDVGPRGWERTGVEFLFRADVIFIRAEDERSVRQVLQTHHLLRSPDLAMPEGAPPDGRRIYGHVAVHVAPGMALEALDVARAEHGGDPHIGRVELIVHTAADGAICPDGEPEPEPLPCAPDPPVSPCRTDGTGVKVVVVDTGLDKPTRDRVWWLAGVEGEDDPLVNSQSGVLATYAGHGTFIAGVVRSMAPAADVFVVAGFSAVGAAFETDLVVALERAIADHDPDVINLSAGTLADTSVGPSTLNDFLELALARNKGLVLVAAAGNDGNRKRFWPAAAPWAVSVGALAANWRTRASFSNFGGWVDVYAPGERVVNAFPTGTLTYNEPPHTGTSAAFDGAARWSGTSFSAPLVAGLVAARMSRTGESGRRAAAKLLRKARKGAVRGVGPVLLPPRDEADCDDRPRCRCRSKKCRGHRC